MVTKTTAEEIPAMKENFADLFNEMFGEDKGLEGSVVKGTIVALNDDFVTIDVGLKSEGRIARREFGFNAEMKVGDQVEVMIINIDRKSRSLQLSIKAKDQMETQEAMQKIQNDSSAASGMTSLGALLKAKFDNKQ